jgi:hypothetical protein
MKKSVSCNKSCPQLIIFTFWANNTETCPECRQTNKSAASALQVVDCGSRKHRKLIDRIHLAFFGS